MEEYIFAKKQQKKKKAGLFFMWVSHTNLNIWLLLEKVISMGVEICSRCEYPTTECMEEHKRPKFPLPTSRKAGTACPLPRRLRVKEHPWILPFLWFDESAAALRSSTTLNAHYSFFVLRAPKYLWAQLSFSIHRTWKLTSLPLEL